jgi:ubiquinone/menaquinone biosynthesis C-methylase UbiE
MDRPDLDEATRQRIVAELGALNDVLGSYVHFLDEMQPLLAPGRTTRVLDLAAGHGGFCVAAAKVAKQRGLDMHFTASDLEPAYLELGAAHARREGLDVDFVQQDALDLSNLDDGAYDIITCTQALHHFPPGLIAVMFEAASRAATRGVVFIDGCRSVVTGIGLASFGILRFRNPSFVHDAWVSARRFFVPEELELLARIGPWGDRVHARWESPGHCVVRLASA